MISNFESDSAENRPICIVSMNTAGIATETAGGTPKDASCVEIGSRFFSERYPCDGD